MSSAFISNLKFEFTESPESTPSVLISFAGKNISYSNGLSANLEAEYICLDEKTVSYAVEAVGEDSFSDEYLQGYMANGLRDFYCPGFEKIYISAQKTNLFGGTGIRFEFFATDPQQENNFPFASSSYFPSSVSKIRNECSCVIYNDTNQNIGNFTFGYHNDLSDELYSLTEDDGKKYFCYTLSIEGLENNKWESATLYYQDPTESDSSYEDLYNYYPVNTNGTISPSKNYWDFTKDITPNSGGKYCLRVRLIDSNGAELTTYQSTIISCFNSRYETNEIAYFDPVFKYNKANEFNSDYCTSETPNFLLTVPGDKVDGVVDDYNNVSQFMEKVVFYRYSESVNTIEDASWEQFTSSNGKTQYDFNMTWLGASGTGGEILDGEKTIVLQISDGVGNISGFVKDGDEKETIEWKKDSVRNIKLYRQSPNSIVFNVIGSSGSEYYTGMYQDKEGHFIPSNKILVNVYANDNWGLELEYKLYLGNSGENAEWRKFNYPNDETTYHNIPFYLNSESNYGIFDNNYSASVNLVFRNKAGVESEVQTKNVFFNTKILKTNKTNLREITGSYKPIIEYYNGDEFVGINQLENFDLSVPKRSWHEIFYPETHGLPLNSEGYIDIDEALKITEANPNYDTLCVKTETGEDGQVIKKVIYDNEQRPLTTWNEYLNSKKYRPLQSNSKVYNSDTGEVEGLAYWIIDNTGYNDFKLEFEHFHLDQTQHVQINTLAPFTGDCLVVYDASAEGATSEYIDKYGRTTYKLIDTSKLTMLAAYSGDGINANRIYPDESAGSLNATANGGFTTEKFDTNRICLIFYSDGGGESSGFKIKASPARESDWINWDIDYKRGEIWLHKIDTELLEGNSKNTLTTQAGYCPEKVRMSYEYSETAFDINYEEGYVKFYEKPIGQILGTFSYYNYDQETGPYKNGEPITTTFALADDDLVDYKDVSVYVSNVNADGKININKDVYYSYDTEPESSGKIIKNMTIYKDSGLVKFENVLPPKNRIFADYFCHSFYRLTDDGYGNLYFYDDVIIPDKSENYPDFTYVDLKVVNEGEATLKNGKIKFTFRGIASGTTSTTITSVLNPDRPWDVQSGTPEETFDQVGGVVSVDYNFPEMDWNNALAIYEGAVDVDENTKLTGGKTEINFGVDMDKKKEIYLRVVWTMFKGGNEYSPEYITPTTAGEKCFSGEIEGSFYTVQI